MYKFCSKCGHKTTLDARFCSKCGLKLEDIVFSYEDPVDYTEESDAGSQSTAELHTESFPADGIDKISSSCRLYNVEVTTSDTKEILISWEKTESWRLDPQINGNTLNLKEHNRLGMHNIHDFFHNSGHNVIKIELPKSKKFDLNLENETGQITLTDIEVLNQAELRSTIGRIKVNNLKAPEALLVSTGTGSIRTSGLNVGQNVRLTSQIGKIIAEDVKTTTFVANNTSGRCSLSDITASQQVTVTGGVGELLLDRITSDKMDIKMNASGNINCQNLYSNSSISIYNSVGNITCGIRDDAVNYTTHCHSDQGQNNYPEISGSGNKHLNVRTSLGSVDIFFTSSKEKKES